MQKKYKLIKTYPGSPKLGTIIQKKLSSYEEVGVYRGFYTTIPSLIEKYPEFWEKVVEEPLFTTEDGVDIYEYDAIWVVSSNFNTIYTTAFSNKYGNSKTAYKIVFSNKKAAEEYILWNKPCLSLNDVASIYPGVNKNHSNTPSHQAERLKELVKSKL